MFGQGLDCCVKERLQNTLSIEKSKKRELNVEIGTITT